MVVNGRTITATNRKHRERDRGDRTLERTLVSDLDAEIGIESVASSEVAERPADINHIGEGDVMSRGEYSDPLLLVV